MSDEPAASNGTYQPALGGPVPESEYPALGSAAPLTKEDDKDLLNAMKNIADGLASSNSAIGGALEGSRGSATAPVAAKPSPPLKVQEEAPSSILPGNEKIHAALSSAVSPSETLSVDDILASFLTSAFQPPLAPVKAAETVASSTATPSHDTELPVTDLESNGHSSEPIDFEAAKAQLDEQTRIWRAENAVARQKAEKSRAKFETLRAEEKKAAAVEAASKPLSKGAAEEKVEAVAGDLLVPVVSSGVKLANTNGQDNDKWAQVENAWEQVNQPLASSSKKPSYAEIARAAAAKSKAPRSELTLADFSVIPPTEESAAAPSATITNIDDSSKELTQKDPSDQLPSLTLSIFGSGIPWQTRVLAITASLGINLILPFINGVALGVGEIFARQVIGGWYATTNIFRKKPVGTSGVGVYGGRSAFP